MEVENLEIALFTPEIALPDIPDCPTYCGGLGVLRGDTLNTAAHTSFPIIGITNWYRNGVIQELGNGRQIEKYVERHPSEFKMKSLNETTDVKIEGRNVKVFGRLYNIVGRNGFDVPLIFLDTDLEENSEEDRKINSQIYVGTPDSPERLKQQVVLGMGGPRILKKLGFRGKYHLDEPFSWPLFFEVANDCGYDAERIRSLCSFTTHTPLDCANGVFPLDLIKKTFGDSINWDFLLRFSEYGFLNTLKLAFRLSGYSNGVSKKHAEKLSIKPITNGVYLPTWTAKPFRKLYDNYLKGWEGNPTLLSSAEKLLPNEEVWNAHMECKSELINYVNSKFGVGMDPEILTIVNARRSTIYKRPNLIFTDWENFWI